ncbi:hypothetical protein ACMBCN_02340, partial [Candidatus Liberibacter asiaticus]|nr:hypothetical protein [Candidatus Liberibacter asiaticus]
MGNNITVFKIQHLIHNPKTQYTQFLFPFFSLFFFSLFFLSFLSYSFSLLHFCRENAESFFFAESFRNSLKTLFTQLECLLWIFKEDTFLLGFLLLFIEEKLALLTYAMSSAI